MRIIRAAFFLFMTFAVYMIFDGHVPNVRNPVTTSGIGTVLLGFYHGFQILWNAIATYGDLIQIGHLKYRGACLYEPTHHGSALYTVSWVGGVLGFIAVFFNTIKGK